MVSSCKDCLHWNNCLAVFLLSSPHNSIQAHVSLNTASPVKNGRMLSAVSLKTMNPCAKLPLITACPTKRSDASFVLLATTKQDRGLLPSPACSWWRACRCRDLTARVPPARSDLRSRESVAEEGGRNTESTWAKGGKRRPAGLGICLLTLSTCHPAEALCFPIARNSCVPCSKHSGEGGCDCLIERGFFRKRCCHFLPEGIGSPLPLTISCSYLCLATLKLSPSLGFQIPLSAWATVLQRVEQGNRSVTTHVSTRVSYDAVRRVLRAMLRRSVERVSTDQPQSPAEHAASA